MPQLSEADLERISEAVRAAEARTAGEIVPFIVPRSGRYEVAVWRAASFFALLALAVSMLFHQFYEGWGLAWLFTGWGTALLALVGGTAGALLAAYVPPVKRGFAGSARLTRRVHRRAMQAFVEEEVFNTRDRTGILLFVSLFEHRIEVLGDAGINAKVAEDEWVDVVLHLREGIKTGRVAEAICAAVGECGGLLEKHGVAVRPDDTNELPDRLRMRKE